MIPFNSTDAEHRLEAIKTEILAAPAREWERDIAERFGWYLARRAGKVMASVNKLRDQQYEHTSDKKKFALYCATELKEISNLVAFAALLVGGNAGPKDNVTAEAYIRLEAELNTPPEEP